MATSCSKVNDAGSFISFRMFGQAFNAYAFDVASSSAAGTMVCLARSAWAKTGLTGANIKQAAQTSIKRTILVLPLVRIVRPRNHRNTKGGLESLQYSSLGYPVLGL